ncbi:hypothetical protein D8Y34_18370 [Escherichia coli]|nr:hypothetical protein D8Y34_18370 [Escherichia coli]RKQ23877.1 hypothetical protein D8Y36_17280 [Escherichia coli]
MCFSAKFFIKWLKLKWILSLRLKGESLEKQSIPDCHKGVLTLIRLELTRKPAFYTALIGNDVSCYCFCLKSIRR